MAHDSVYLFDLGIHYLVESEACSIVEHTLPPRALGAPLHSHRHEDEYSYVLEGQLGAQLGDEIVEAGPGELVQKPRGQMHTFWNAGDEPLRFLEIISPGAFAGYFRELAPALAAGDETGIQEIVSRYELDIDFSTIPTLAERHGLRIGAPA